MDPGAHGLAASAVALPYGVFAEPGSAPRVGVRWGEQVVDLRRLGGPATEALDTPSLNAFMALGPAAWRAQTQQLQAFLDNASRDEAALVPLDAVTLGLPFEVADYVDFYASEVHATNVGRMFRPDGEPLTPNWKHLPIGYHGRAGTVVASGTPVRRPRGQLRPDPAAPPVFGPTRRLDVEVEVGYVVGVPAPDGCVPPSAFADHVFGVVLLNDWSARDIQSFEYVPLGPFLGKSFATSVSHWVTPMAALEHAKVPAAPQVPQPLPYLRGADEWGLDIALQLELNGSVVSRPSYTAMHWTPAQMLAHLTVNGASLRTGDLFGSGTVSDSEQFGSLLELTLNGAEPLTLADGSSRAFLEDGDTVRITATAPGPDGSTVTLGEVTGTIEPARV